MSIKSLVDAYNALDKVDLRVLRVMEIAHSKYIYIPYKLIVNWSKYNEEIISKSLSKLNKLKLIQRMRGPYEGYRLTFRSYDILALHTLRKMNKVVSISPTPIGVGKEAEVYVGEAPGGLKVALKFHRTGTSSFIHVRKFRAFVRRRRHLTKLYEARLSAQMEYIALTEVFDAGGKVPEPIAANRHVVVMRYIDGVELYRAEPANPKAVLEDVEATIEAALSKGIVHGDLTQYNILVLSDEAFVIDWPQWIPIHHPNAIEILNRDLIKLNDYLKKYNVEINIEKINKIINEYRERVPPEHTSELFANVLNILRR